MTPRPPRTFSPTGRSTSGPRLAGTAPAGATTRSRRARPSRVARVKRPGITAADKFATIAETRTETLGNGASWRTKIAKERTGGTAQRQSVAPTGTPTATTNPRRTTSKPHAPVPTVTLFAVTRLRIIALGAAA